ncbi:class I SAM-dependent methyltransferase [bacterium]|nr:class I SAM-dependent methyltransferase [bacterium]
MKNYEKYSKMVEAWRNFVFPARPSEDEMEIFDELMSKHVDQKLLILGATPEFRDLGLKYKMEVTCADINPDMLEGMKFLMKQENKNEKLIETDWLKMPFDDNTFDVIFAEQSINILTTDKFEDFFKENKRVLKQGGIFVLKIIIQSQQTDDEVIKIYKEENRDIHFLYDQLFHVKKRYDHNGQGSHKRLGEDFGELLKQGKISQEDYDKFFAAWGAIVKADLKLNAMEQKDFDKLAKKYFQIKSILFGKDKVFHCLHPIYVFKK